MPTLKVLDRPFSPPQQTTPNTSQKPPTAHEDAPPQALDVEMALLGAMIQEPQAAVPQAALMLRVDSFASPVHGTIFQALCDMWDSENQLDLLTFSQYLEDNKIAARVGGRAYITQLFTTSHTGAAFVEHYSNIIREKHLLRRMQRHAFSLAKATGDHPDESAVELLRSFAGSYERLLEDAEEQETAFLDAAHLLNGEFPIKPPEIVRHVLYQGSKMILGGTSKARKTWALMDLALAVSTGTQWWGFPTTRSHVCYVNLELPPWHFHERLQMISKSLGVKPDEQMLKILHLRGQAQSIEDFRRHYSLMLKSGHFGLLILDPMYKLLGRRDENKAGDVASLCNEVDRISDETGASIAFAGHFSKGNQAEKESIDRISGSGVFARDQDTIMTMTSHEDIDCYTVDTTLRLSPPIKQFVVSWQDPVFVREDLKNPASLRGKTGRPPDERNEARILGAMSIVYGAAAPQLQKDLIEYGVSRATFYRLLTKLEDGGKIEKKEDNLWYQKGSSQKSQNTSETSETYEKN